MSTTSGIATPRISWIGPERRALTTMLVTRLIAMMSNQLTALAVPWFVLSITGSATKMGITAAAAMVPSVIMAVFGGAIADRMSPRKLAAFADVLSGITVAAVPLLFALDLLTFPVLLILMFLGAVFDSPGYSARTRLLPVLAERGKIEIERATSIQGMSYAMSMLFGTLIAGLLIGLLGATSVLWINATVFLFSAAVFWLLIPETHIPREEKTSLTDDIREGVRFLAGHEVLAPFILISLLLNMLFSPLIGVLLPYFAQTEWNSPGRLGIVMSGFGAGALLGSLGYGALSGKVNRRMLLTIAAACFSLPLFGLVPLPNVAITWAVVFLIGFGSGVTNPMFSTILMRTTPNDMLGRVGGVMDAGSMVASPFGMLLAGPMVDAIGLQATFLAIAIAMVLLATYAVLCRAARKLNDISFEPVDAETVRMPAPGA